MFKLLLFGTLIVVPMTSIPDEKDYRMWNTGCAEHEKCYPKRKAQLANKNDSKKMLLKLLLLQPGSIQIAVVHYCSDDNQIKQSLTVRC